MPGTTTEGLPYPLPTEPVRDGAVAIQNTATAAGTTFMLPLNLAAGRYSRVGVMTSELAVNFNSSGRIQLDTSGTFSSIIYATCQSTTYPWMCACVNRNSAVLEFYCRYDQSTPVVGATNVQLYIVGIRK